MEKNDLKALIEEIYENLLKRIDAEENATKSQVVNYLKDAIDVVLNIDDKDKEKKVKEFFKVHKLKRAIVKPATGGSSIGVHSVSTAKNAVD
ncbi:MAG: hypothetical protein Q8N78_02460, partial [Sulfurimonas sp.]|nr:hypothetical protein [Sulfurimonas sp.]